MILVCLELQFSLFTAIILFSNVSVATRSLLDKTQLPLSYIAIT